MTANFVRLHGFPKIARYSLQHKINKQNWTVIFVIEMMQRHVLSFRSNVELKKNKFRERPLTLLDLNYPSKQI